MITESFGKFSCNIVEVIRTVFSYDKISQAQKKHKSVYSEQK